MDRRAALRHIISESGFLIDDFADQYFGGTRHRVREMDSGVRPIEGHDIATLAWVAQYIDRGLAEELLHEYALDLKLPPGQTLHFSDAQDPVRPREMFCRLR